MAKKKFLKMGEIVKVADYIRFHISNHDLLSYESLAEKVKKNTGVDATPANVKGVCESLGLRAKGKSSRVTFDEAQLIIMTLDYVVGEIACAKPIPDKITSNLNLLCDRFNIKMGDYMEDYE